jgi:hypothetical protein
MTGKELTRQKRGSRGFHSKEAKEALQQAFACMAWLG